MFLLFQLHFHFFHFFAHSFVGTHAPRLHEHFDTKDQEKTRCGEIGQSLGNQCWHGVTEDGGEDSHGDEGGKCGCEDDQPRVAHGHESGHKEGLVANLGEDDHGE